MRADRVEDREEHPTSGKAGKARFFYGYIVAAAGFGVFLIGSIIPSTFGIFYRPMLTDFGWSRAETALALSLLLLVGAIAGIAMGWLTDRLGPRLVVMVFGSFLGICFLLMSRINSLWQFQLNYALAGGIGFSTVLIPAMTTVARWFVKRRGLMIGIVQTGLGVGGLVFAPLTGWLISTYGWRSSYVILGIVVLVGIIISGLFLWRDPADLGQSPDGVSAIMDSGVSKHSHNQRGAGLSLREAMGTSQFWIIAGLYASFGFCRSTFTTHTAAHVQDLGFSLADGANVLAALIGSSIIGRIGMGRVADIIGNRPAFLLSFVATAIALAWALVAKDLWGLYLFALVFGFGWGAQAVLRFAITSEVFGLASLGIITGVLGLTEAAAASSGSYLAGYIFDVVGTYEPTFLMGTVVSIIGILLTWLLKAANTKER